MTRDEVRTALFNLPEKEREELALEILAEGEIPAGVEQAHMSEVQRRIKEFREGKVKGKSMKEILNNAEARIRAAEAQRV